MVPFADCLNHSNVQTKYDFNVDGNNTFRLFPSGKNRYPKGSEVFNSYGRRANDNLLQDYGFAMLDNEWEEVELLATLPEDDANLEWKRQILFEMGLCSRKVFRMGFCGLPFEILHFLRVVALNDNEVQRIKDTQALTDVEEEPRR
eukprot:gene24004-25636_t